LRDLRKGETNFPKGDVRCNPPVKASRKVAELVLGGGDGKLALTKGKWRVAQRGNGFWTTGRDWGRTAETKTLWGEKRHGKFCSEISSPLEVNGAWSKFPAKLQKPSEWLDRSRVRKTICVTKRTEIGRCGAGIQCNRIRGNQAFTSTHPNGQQ